METATFGGNVFRGGFLASHYLTNNGATAAQAALLSEPCDTGMFLGEWLFVSNGTPHYVDLPCKKLCIFTKRPEFTQVERMPSSSSGSEDQDVWFPIDNVVDVIAARDHPVYSVRDSVECEEAFIVLHRTHGYRPVMLRVPRQRWSPPQRSRWSASAENAHRKPAAST